MLFPFHIRLYIPRFLWNWIRDGLGTLRIISRRKCRPKHASGGFFKGFDFPINFVTAPLIADLFLLAILAIGRKEVHDGTLGAEGISPLAIMGFFLSLAYIAISIDASGLIRYLAFRVLQWGGTVGHRLFFYLYVFFFAISSFIGNDPVILSGTAFLAYMTRVSSNIVHPRAWIHTQFAVANIASALLVSSNPTNLVLAGAFDIKFFRYTGNMIVPVVVTGIVLFPFLLYIVFASEPLIPVSINMHELPEEARARKPVNPNIPHARGNAEEDEKTLAGGEEAKLLSLEEIMNPFLDKKGAAFGAIIMSVTLLAIIGLNAADQKVGFHQVFWATVPAAFVMLWWDVGFGWFHRHETREIASNGRQDKERGRLERIAKKEEAKRVASEQERDQSGMTSVEEDSPPTPALFVFEPGDDSTRSLAPEAPLPKNSQLQNDQQMSGAMTTLDQKQKDQTESKMPTNQDVSEKNRESSLENQEVSGETQPKTREQQTLVSLAVGVYEWSQETFPTVTTVLTHLPYALVPFALSMFVLVQALVTKGWVPVFAYGWDHWVNKTGTVGAVGGMAFLSVILCNVSHFFRMVCAGSHPCRKTTSADISAYFLVCRHKYRNHNPFVSCSPSMASNPPTPRCVVNQRPDFLGDSIQHGAWGQLWCFQRGVQCIACRSALAGYSCQETHSGEETRICACQSSYHRHFYDGRLRRSRGASLHC